MLKIRLARIGRKNDPSFRVVVTEHTRGPKSGKHLEILGNYNPKSDTVVLEGERINYWISNGAQVSDTVHNLLVGQGIIQGKKINVLPKKSPIVKEADGEGEESKEEPQEESKENAKEEKEKEESKEEKGAPTDEDGGGSVDAKDSNAKEDTQEEEETLAEDPQEEKKEEEKQEETEEPQKEETKETKEGKGTTGETKATPKREGK